MLISLSAATHLYWLARYVVRAETIIKLNPLESDAAAQAYADAFGVDNVDTLKAMQTYMNDEYEYGSFVNTIKNINENIQSVRGIISQPIYEAYNALWRNHNDYDFIVSQLPIAIESIKELPENAYLFWQLGLLLEEFDHTLRLGKPLTAVIEKLTQVSNSLPLKWTNVSSDIDQLINDPNWGNFYLLTYNLHDSLERGV